MNKLFSDISSLTNVSEDILKQLSKTSTYCIGHTVYENTISGETNLHEIDLGIGTLYIKVDDEQIRYKFIPSKQLEEAVSHGAQKRSPLAIKVNEKLREKLESTFRGLI